MKAKDYAKKYNESPTDETLAEIANSFMHEIGELIESRHARSNSACIAILKELDQKWVSNNEFGGRCAQHNQGAKDGNKLYSLPAPSHGI